SAEIALCLDITFVDAAPGCAQQKIGDVSGIRTLPLSNFRGCFVLLRAANQRRPQRSKLLENLLLQNRTYICSGGEVGLATGIATLAAHVDEIGERLRPRGPLMEISTLPAESIRRDYALRLELIVTHGTTE